MSEKKYRWILNGLPIESPEEDAQTELLHYLQKMGRLCSPKRGCSHGECGSCTILVDGQPHLACQQTLEDQEHRIVTTLEGFRESDLQRYAKAFAKVPAACGYCIPGLVVHLHALLQENPRPNRKELMSLLDAHYCRCTGYLSWMEAMFSLIYPTRTGISYKLTTPKEDKQLSRFTEADPQKEKELFELLRGTPHFLVDKAPSEGLYGSVLFAPCTRGRLLSIDYKKVLEMKGVHAVITSEDIPGKRHRTIFGINQAIILAKDEEIYSSSEIIALVAADDPKTAQLACQQIRIQFEELDPYIDAEILKDQQTQNTNSYQYHRKGDVNSAFRSASAVVSGTWHSSIHEPGHLQPVSCIAYPSDTKLQLHTSGISVAKVRSRTAEFLGIPEAAVEITPYPACENAGPQRLPTVELCTALLAFHTKKPVKLTLSPEETWRLYTKQYPTRVHASLSCDASGYFTGLKMKILADGGAYPMRSAQLLERMLFHACGPYHIPDFDLEARVICTNNPSADLMHTRGAQQVNFALESVITMLSERLHMDAWSIRYQNALKPQDTFPNGQIVGEHNSVLPVLEAIRDTYYRYKPRAGLACAFQGLPNQQIVDLPLKLKLQINKNQTRLIILPFASQDRELFALLRWQAAKETDWPVESFQVELRPQQAYEEAWKNDPSTTQAALLALQDALSQLALARQGTPLFSEGHFEGSSAPTSNRGDTQESSYQEYSSFNYAAQVIVLNEQGGEINRIFGAHQVGAVVHEASTFQALENAIHMGLGHALTEHFPMSDGQSLASSLAQLGSIEPSQLPGLQIHLLQNTPYPEPQATSQLLELGIAPIAPALADAIHKVEKKRCYSLPMQETQTAFQHQRLAQENLYPPDLHNLQDES